MAASAEPIRIAVAGTGFGTRTALPVYQALAEFEPVAIWSRRPERATAAAEAAGVALGSASFDELLAVEGLEAVHVATPVASHHEMALAVLRRGLHLLCEKPLAMNLAQAREIARAADEAGVVVSVNFSRRFQETRRRLLEVTAEIVGQPRLVSISLVHTDHATPESRPFAWVNDAALGGGRLQAYGIHDLDLLLEAFGEVQSVAAALEVGVPQRPDRSGEQQTVTAEETYALVFRMRGGGLAVVTLTANARHARGDVIEIHGAEGTVRLDADKRLFHGRAGEQLRVEGPLSADSSDAFTRVASAFAAAIRDGAAPDPSLDDGLRAQALMDAIARAHAERRWVEVERP